MKASALKHAFVVVPVRIGNDDGFERLLTAFRVGDPKRKASAGAALHHDRDGRKYVTLRVRDRGNVIEVRLSPRNLERLADALEEALEEVTTK
jgi:hypothetical protein